MNLKIKLVQSDIDRFIWFYGNGIYKFVVMSGTWNNIWALEIRPYTSNEKSHLKFLSATNRPAYWDMIQAILKEMYEEIK